MSSKTTKKKPSADLAPVKKMKMPKAFIVRPQFNHDLSAASIIHVHPEILTALELRKGDLVYVSKNDTGVAGVVGQVEPLDLILAPEVITISTLFRNLGGFLLGDRISIAKYSQQPEYAKSVTVHSTVSHSADTISEALAEIGLIYPGLQLLPGTTITSVNDDLDSSMSKLAIDSKNFKNLMIDDDLQACATVSPVYIYTNAPIEQSEHPLSRSRFPNLPVAVDFSQVGGLLKQIQLLQSTIELPLNNPTLFSDFGISPPRGILLHGPPGTGKTMLLRCVAHQTNAHVLTVNGPSIVSKYLGETENAIRDIFVEARKYQPSIIFMDEIDSLVPNRNSDDSGETESRVVATMLTMMDGMGDSGRIVVVGATNRPNLIDPALRRPGRFDQEVEIGIPDADARCDILRKQFSKMNPDKYELSDEEIAAIAAKTHGYVGADLTALCRELVMKAIARGLKDGTPHADIKLRHSDVLEAYPEIVPSAMREIFLEMPKVYWSDIGGQEELKKKLIEVVQLPLEAALSFRKLGVLAPKGVLLYGPPGCSKTLTAKALATELGLNFLAVKGPEIFNKYVGESERTIREIFRKARAASPLIIFFDEIDAISGDRENANTSASSNVLTSLLNEIDGVEELKGVVIVAATNRPTEIDPALLRPGRLDRHIYVAPPDYGARLQILINGSKKFELGDDLKAYLQEVAKVTEGCSGAEMALLTQEAGLAAVMENRDDPKVDKRHFEHALAGLSRGITLLMLEYYRLFADEGGIEVSENKAS